MKKYKLINKKSCSKNGVLREGESCRFNNNCIYPNCCETICDKVTIDGFDYYVSEEEIIKWSYNDITGELINITIKGSMSLDEIKSKCKKVIVTNNPNIDIPKVVDEVERLAKEYAKGEEVVPFHTRKGFIHGYNKSQATHPFSEEDMIEFLNWIRDNTVFDSAPKPYHRKTQTRLSQEELLQLWKEQRPKIVYYE